MKENPGETLPVPFILNSADLNEEQAYKYFSVISCRMLSWDILSLQQEGNQRAFCNFDKNGDIIKSDWIAP